MSVPNKGLELNKIFPEKLKLKKGDCIGILACSGATASSLQQKKLACAKSYFEKSGFSVKVSQTAIDDDWGYLCANDEKRASAVNEFFADSSVHAIFCARGGYGSIRILDKIDYDLIKNNPKIFAGYSDITALSLMIYKKTGLVTYNAPMAIPDFGGEINEFSEESFKKFFIENDVIENIKLHNPVVYGSGSAQGIIWGGNLSTVQSLCGLDFIPDEKFIFIAEDVNEPVYKIDKMFNQLLNIDKFKQNLEGVVLGDFSGIDNMEYFEFFFENLAQTINVPVVSGLKFGHEDEKETFAIGAKCALDTDKKQILYI